jgi:hypothetical protein
VGFRVERLLAVVGSSVELFLRGLGTVCLSVGLPDEYIWKRKAIG